MTKKLFVLAALVVAFVVIGCDQSNVVLQDNASDKPKPPPLKPGEKAKDVMITINK